MPYVRGFLQLLDHRSHLDCFWAGTKDRKNFKHYNLTINLLNEQRVEQYQGYSRITIYEQL